ncbi:DUF3310 domain-containing protein [Staphylococcus nepalensis]|uniref:DUF3310 domain-containing protein n=1 Tax=Staphylococcus nepalensis TaxID=214473 RepID=A0ABS3L3X2_9STAP|nr:DUF3310 domain-containing protein [Staphylococcus nepalensis]MBO1214107.1 DUF3310 domain-containing protein [Staphylococcus nepalensis]MBO1217400.1 DUF3310 domain-containing protein [Staphylococcus nepalensis]MBO1228210.1 DUF3310 domain-containing protein [Staphylococcus nepalensis]MBO1233742.1 DUF3310 domain-containing protein [Staphylococcus nepalensis]MBO1236569.1 DUF3310 domain-containing protein [Staphylococcus nepalensis]
MHKFKTELELEKVNGVHVYLREDSDWITVQESMSEQLEEVLRENLREANEMLLGINDVYENEPIQSNDVQQRKRKDTVNHPSHYNYGDIEVIDFIEQVTKHYNPNVAYHIGNAIKYLARSPHKNGKEDVDKARWYVERAFENWEQ